MKTQNKKWLTLMLAGLCAVSLGTSVASATANADEATSTVTASTYAISDVFQAGQALDAEDKAKDTNGTAAAEEGKVAFTLGNGDNMLLKRDLAFKWYEAKNEAKYLTVKFAFKELNFNSIIIKIESASSVASDDKMATNAVKFTVKEGKVWASVINGNEENAKESEATETAITAGSEVTLALAEGTKFDTFAVKVNGEALKGEFTNIGANYADYEARSPKQKQSLEVKAETATDVKAVLLLNEINGQRFDNVKDNKIADTAAPVLVVNEDVNGFLIGTAFALSYEKIDVLQASSLTETKKYYQYNPADTAASYTSTLSTSTYFMDTVYYTNGTEVSKEAKEGYTATSVMFEEDREYVSIQITLGDDTFDDTKDADNSVPFAKKTYDLSWYATPNTADREVVVSKTLGEVATDYIVIDRNDEGATYSYITLNEEKAENVLEKEAMDAQVAIYQGLLKEAATDVYAGSNSDINIPAVDWLIKDNGGYRSLKFTISYKTPSSSSAKTASSLSYNALDIPTSEEGLYEFKIFASDKAGNTMKYYLGGKLVDVSTSNVWDIEEIPSFTFEIKNLGIKVEEATSASQRKVEKILDETYTLSGLTVKGATNQQSAYALYRLDTTGYTGKAITQQSLTNVTYEDIRSAAMARLSEVGTKDCPTYFDLYLDIYAEKIATAIDGEKAAVKACFKRVEAINADVKDRTENWEADNKYNWNDSSKSFKTVEEGEYLIIADFWEKELPMQRASAYKVVIVESEEDVTKGESKVLAWMKNNKVSVILFGVAAVMLILIVVLLLVKPSEETLEDVDKEVEKKKEKDEE